MSIFLFSYQFLSVRGCEQDEMSISSMDFKLLTSLMPYSSILSVRNGHFK